MNVRPPRHADAEELRRFTAPSSGNPVLDREVTEARFDALERTVGGSLAGATFTISSSSTANMTLFARTAA